MKTYIIKLIFKAIYKLIQYYHNTKNYITQIKNESKYA